MSNSSPIISEYVALDLQIKALEEKREALKKQLIELADAELSSGKSVKLRGDKCEATISKSYMNRFSQHLAQTLLSEEDFKRCFAIDIKPTYRVIPKVLSLV